ncbi:MAG: hypothetical protein HOI70_04800 [Opitutae bacterium]|jgi:choline dehydrogenase-like flavoprotein|nr:hypothetical protein [Opitutae bacterium]
MDDFIVIGSGLAGLSAVKALLSRGFRTRLIDGGYGLEPERSAVLKRMQEGAKSSWSKEDISKIMENNIPSADGLALKHSYGSDFPYRNTDVSWDWELEGAKMFRSLAKGGLSNVWGAAILPVAQQDVREWPIAYNELDEHYRKIFEFMPLSGGDNDYDGLLPTHTSSIEKFDLCEQARHVLDKSEKNKQSLRENGILIGQSRLAADLSGNKGKPKCSKCSLCLHGCPLGLIYNSKDTLDDLGENKLLTYSPGYLVNRFVEKKGHIEIHTDNIRTKEKSLFKCRKLFLAAGIMSTNRILLRSLNLYDQPVKLAHSDLFQVPVFLSKNFPNVSTEETLTLSQLNMEIKDERLGDRLTHIQLYGYNDLLETVFDQKMGAIKGPIKNFIRKHVIGRIMVAKGYLHSNHSSEIKMILDKKTKKLLIKGIPNKNARKLVNGVIRKLFFNSRKLGFTPIPGMTKLSLPGEGNHSGGSFPMSENPSMLQSDVMGRPGYLKRTHVVDSSILPSITATTIALTAMANAHRIASKVELN